MIAREVAEQIALEASKIIGNKNPNYNAKTLGKKMAKAYLEALQSSLETLKSSKKEG